MNAAGKVTAAFFWVPEKVIKIQNKG